MKTKGRKKYTQSFKSEAVKLITEEGYSCAEVGGRLEVNPSIISRWKRESMRSDPAMSLEQMVVMRSEIKELRKENKRLKMEHEILKKQAKISIC